MNVIPKTAFGYATGLKWFLEHVESINVTSLENSRILKITKEGMMKVWRLDANNKEAKRRRLGASRDLIITACAVELKNHTDWQNLGAAICIKVAFMVLARKSDMLVTNKQNHHLRYKSVQFSIFNKKLNDYEDLKSSISCKNIVKYKLEQIAFVHINKVDMKNDQDGEGNLHSFMRLKEGYNTEKTFCIVSDCYQWCIASKPTSMEDPFLSFPDKIQKRVVLHYSYSLQALRDAGKRNGLDSQRITLYSLRIGGCTTLASAGIDPVTIKRAGGWKGDSFMLYIRECMSVSKRINNILCESNNYSMKDMKQWCMDNNVEDDEPFDITED